MSPFRIARYARYQVGDYLMQRGALPFFLVLMLAAIPRFGMTHNAGPNFWTSPDGQNFAKQMFLNTITNFLPLGAYFAVVGLLSGDRQKGHFRFLFSKPVAMDRYYLQAMLLHGAAFVALFGVLAWGWGLATTHVSVWGAVQAAALTWVLLGGIGLALGALTRFDGGVLMVSYLAATITQQLSATANDAVPSWVAVLARVLPPAQALDQTRGALYSGQPIDLSKFWLVVGYGAGAWLVGWIAMRRGSLQR